jgi:hypothetical protein
VFWARREWLPGGSPEPISPNCPSTSRLYMQVSGLYRFYGNRRKLSVSIDLQLNSQHDQSTSVPNLFCGIYLMSASLPVWRWVRIPPP